MYEQDLTLYKLQGLTWRKLNQPTNHRVFLYMWHDSLVAGE